MFNINGEKYVLSNGKQKDRDGKIICDTNLPTCIINGTQYPNCCLVRENKSITAKSRSSVPKTFGTFSSNFSANSALPPSLNSKYQTRTSSIGNKRSSTSHKLSAPISKTYRVINSQTKINTFVYSLTQIKTKINNYIHLFDEYDKVNMYKIEAIISEIEKNYDIGNTIQISNTQNQSQHENPTTKLDVILMLIEDVKKLRIPVGYSFENEINEILEILNTILHNYSQQIILGGKKTKQVRSQYKASLEKKDVKKLYKMAKEMGIAITKKRDGKTSYIKKETVVKKICDAKYPSKNKKNSKK